MITFGPADLIGWLATQCGTPLHCVECGAGDAEISAFLAPRFHTVTATDLKPPRSSITAAKKARFNYLSCPAETLPFEDHSVDMVISMQALQHFDVKEHVKEASRILRPGGVFAALAWGEMQLPEAVAAEYAPVFEALEPYWEPERDWVVGGYSDLEFAGRPLSLPKARMQKQMTYDDLERHIRGLSASRFAKSAGTLPPRVVQKKGHLDTRFEVSWPVVGRAFKFVNRQQYPEV
ncbi:class I SAM-dependent methyltransferase [Lentibacter algarum]|uniref:class I SAM-dependent methyltransferase n=1 Tax=Lentibacter algarum TaxID=576131 RepID=UPI001C087C3D|nr:class I SAM-dependent methyltransferase [Lentibacter algarum]MBU2983297.1 class I SAM-dependent methyltransferase [Lentibacter algarum]